MTQPEFVINERTMGVMGQDSKGNPKYFEKASFSITLLKHVEAEGQDSGFLVISEVLHYWQRQVCYTLYYCIIVNWMLVTNYFWIHF